MMSAESRIKELADKATFRDNVRIKTFEFRVSFMGGTEQTHILRPEDYASYHKCVERGDGGKLFSEAEIDKTINDFMENREVIDIKINSETVHRHNNAGCDSIVRIYTILYK